MLSFIVIVQIRCLKIKSLVRKKENEKKLT
jgi:hypothetical protein